jgi:hypothetical protein
MAGVNVKMGVSGVQQFKNAMKESQAAVKTLDAELKLNEQQLKVTGDAQQYMETKTKLLQEQIQKQTEIVTQSQKALEAMRKNGVSESSVAFQNMKQQSLAAQTQLAAMQSELENVGSAGEQAANDISGIGSQLNSIKLNASWENIAQGVEKITEKMEAAGRAAFNMGKKIVQATLSGGQWADDLATTADQWEITPEQLYRMQQTANLIDTNAETIFQSRQKLIKAMGGENDKAAMGAFAALGISNLSGSDQNIENVFWKAGEGLMNMEDKVARNEYAMKLFGRSWTDMIPIFKAGRQAYEETMNSWTWMGDEQFSKLTSLNDEQMKLQTEWENFQHQFEAALAPALTEVMTILNELMHEFNTYLTSDAGQEMLQQLGEAVSGLFEDLQTIKPEEVMEKIKGALDGVKSGLEWLIKNKEGVRHAIEAIAVAFGGLKLAGLAANIAQIVSGLNGLGAAAPAAAAGGASVASSAAGGGLWGIIAGTAGKIAGGVGAGLAVLTQGLWDKNYVGSDDILDQNGQLTEDARKNGYTQDANGIHAPNATNPVSTVWAEQWMVDARKEAEALAKIREEERAKAVEEGRGTDWSGTGEAVYVDHRSRMGRLPTQESFDRMTEVAAENTEAANKAKESSDKMTSAAEDLSNMPSEMYSVVENAIKNGMSSVAIIIGAGAVDTIGRQLGNSMGANLVQMTR